MRFLPLRNKIVGKDIFLVLIVTCFDSRLQEIWLAEEISIGTTGHHCCE